jgi:hypothetical protein
LRGELPIKKIDARIAARLALSLTPAFDAATKKPRANAWGFARHAVDVRSDQ